MIRFKCPHCGKEVSAGDEAAGKQGRCPGCKELFKIPAGAARKPAVAPAVERRTRPDDDEDEAPPPRKKAVAVDDEDEAIAELPRKSRRREDDDDDEAIAESPRKRRHDRDEDYDDDDDDRPRRKDRRDEEDDDEERPRRKRSRDDEDDGEEDRPRKKKKRRGEFANCPNCGCRGHADKVGFTWWGGLIGPRLLSHVRCKRCGTCYNGKSGNYNTTGIIIYSCVGLAIGLGIGLLALIAEMAR